MTILDIIELKKNKNELTEDQISFLVEGFTLGEIKDYQMAAMAMAIRLNGMTITETVYLTKAMMHSGDVFDLSAIKGIKVDKHSTGGIGDKTSIAVGPIVASLGALMAKMSGRGLGFTGGTIDKLESIKGFKTELNSQEFIDQANKIGLVIISQSKNIVPADKKLYALRDVTGTIDSIPLITSSIMSKKLATGSDAILLDVKMGDGAFMKTYAEAEELATWMISIGKELGRDVKAEITNMNCPLGRAIGNKNEIIEAMEMLQGRGPTDFVELVISTSSNILVQARLFSNLDEAAKNVKLVINNGKAFEKFKEWIITQGGDLDDLLSNNFLDPKYTHQVKTNKAGYMEVTSAAQFGLAAMRIGAGRTNKDDAIDNDAGIYLNKKTNESVKKGDVLFTLYSSNEIPENIIKDLNNAYNINDKKIENKIILGRLG
ncbi:thymidine phosphorylase [Candidatus Mycoplasma mahonii]|uniref:thymidine phosphorylase n=1 Tax=Candidatus Mycoplasma mahonii TaxID=3004105 RepID=UPI0026ECD605|nr:thymidine phosphorylase [Candidatus Mycoplasma mahonii]WKX02173.1 thymidine phosphorylase [Candidatus Mycoplasma mahonii]